MKQFKLYSMAFAAMMLAACSSSDEVANDANSPSDEATPSSYLTVNMQNVLDMPGTRADGNYEYGQGLENTIKKVRFYFFYQDGTPFVMYNQSVNYIDESAMTFTDGTEENEEKISNVTLLLKGEKREAPASMIAVVNPDICGLGKVSMGLSAVRTAVYSTYHSTEGFVMSNSVYEQTGTDKCATLVEGHVKATEEEAKKDPVDIYVERVNAKVAVSKGNAEGKWTKLTYEGKDVDAAVVGSYAFREYDEEKNVWVEKTKEVYALQFGWNLSDENGKAELTKNIETSWTNTQLGITPWSSADLHRSFWSTSVAFNTGAEGEANTPIHPAYKDCTTAFDGALYTLPNTPTAAVAEQSAYTQDNNLTKVVVKAQLVTKGEDGEVTPLAVTEYKGVKYAEPEMALRVVANEYAQYYVELTGLNGAKEYNKLSPEDFAFYGKTGKYNDKGRDDVSANASLKDLKDYQVAAQLDSKIKKLYVKNGSDFVEATEGTIEQINKTLADYPASIAANGATYYFTPIRHLGTDIAKVGYYGVVRNHSYKITINSISGLGTPVWDPDNAVIDPELPNDDKTYLAAQIKVLSWRVVKSEVDLDKTK